MDLYIIQLAQKVGPKGRLGPQARSGAVRRANSQFKRALSAREALVTFRRGLWGDLVAWGAHELRHDDRFSCRGARHCDALDADHDSAAHHTPCKQRSLRLYWHGGR